MVEMENYRRRWQGFAFEGGMHRAGFDAGPRPGSWEEPPANDRKAIASVYDAAIAAMQRRQTMEAATSADTDPANALDLKRHLANIIYELMKSTRDKLFEEVPVKRPAAEAEPTTDLNTAAAEATQLRQQMEATTAHPQYDPNTPGLAKFYEKPAKPTVDMSNINAAASEATNVAQQMQQALSVQATPQVNVEQLRQAIALAHQLKAALSGIGTAVSAAHNTVSAEMRRNFADYGVSP